LLVVLCELGRKLHIILVGKLLEKTSLGDPDTDGKDNIQIFIMETEHA
jgi:hypothetical protein